MTETVETRRKRLRFRCWHRGTKELDLMLGRFAERELAGLAEAEIARLEALLEVPDPVLYAWLTRRAAPPPEFDHDLLRRLIRFNFPPDPT